MKKLALGLGVLLMALLAASAANAQPFGYYNPALPVAPDACGPGWHNTTPCGMTYGPNHWLRPAWDPFNGLLPPMGRPGGPPSIANFQGNGNGNGNGYCPPGSPVFANHPYARGPRDFFMLD